MVGPWFGTHVILILGLALYVVGTMLLLTNLMRTVRAAWPVLPAAVGHFMFGYA